MPVALPGGMFNRPKNQWGVGPLPGTVYIPSPASLNDDIDQVIANGLTGVPFNFVDSRSHWTTAGTGGCAGKLIFSRTLYQSQLERFSLANLGATLYNKLVAALVARQIVVYCVDEAYIAQFCNSIVADDVDWMGFISKQTFGADCYTVVRMGAADMEILPTSGVWNWIDFAWLQSEGPSHLYSNGQTVQAYWVNGYGRLQAVNVGCYIGHNLPDGGDQTCWPYLYPSVASGRTTGTFVGSGASPGTDYACGLGGPNTRWYTRPDQLKSVFDALNDPTMIPVLAQCPGFYLWSYAPGATTNGTVDAFLAMRQARADVQAALAYGAAILLTCRGSYTPRTPKGLAPPAISASKAFLPNVTAFNIGTGAASTTKTVAHGIQGTPKAIQLTMSGRTENVNAVGLASAQFSRGWSIGAATNVAIGTVEVHNGTGAGNICKRIAIQDGCLVELKTDGTLGGKAIVQSWDETNIVFSIVSQFSADFRVSLTVWGGQSIKHVALGVQTGPTGGTAPYTTDFTPLSFTPKGDGRTLGMFMAAGDTAIFDGTISDDSGRSFGFATSAAQQAVAYAGAENQTNPTAVRVYTFNGECMATARTAVGATNWRVALTAWIANGWRFNNLETTSLGTRYAYLIIDGPMFAVKSAVSATSLTTVAITGAGFKPEAGVINSARHAANTQDTPTSGTGHSLGSFDDDGGQQAHGMEQTNNVATSVVKTIYRTDACYAGITAAGAVDALAALQSRDADGITLVMNDADSGAFQFHAALMAGIITADGSPKLPFRVTGDLALSINPSAGIELPVIAHRNLRKRARHTRSRNQR